MTPTTRSERLHFVDVLRGFAILGILLVNISGFGFYGLFPGADLGPFHRLVAALTQVLVVAKFYSLFSFLFGWGMAIQLERAAERGHAFLPLYLRRLFLLLLIGLIHAIFIWSGDILALYALLGFLLLLFRRRSPRTLLLAAMGALLFSLLWNAPWAPMETVRDGYRELFAFASEISDQSVDVYAEGGYWAATARRLQTVATRLPASTASAGNIFAMFLLGLYVGKRRLFQTIDERIPWLRRVAAVTMVLGLGLNLLMVWLMVQPAMAEAGHRFLRLTARTFGAPALMLFYISGMILLLRHRFWQERLAPLAAVGRTALSNYLLQSVVGTLFFYGYGLGFINRIGPATGLLLAVAFFLLQIRISRWWLARYRFGPVEWLWRSLAYGQWQPVRRRQAGGGGAPPRPLLGTLSRRASGLNPTLLLGLTWILLLLWAGGLAHWYRALEAPPVVAAVGALDVTSTPVSNSVAEAIVSPTPRATPAVAPVAYTPGAVVASGDMIALAETLALEQMMSEIEVLAGPRFAGRLAGSAGGHAAGDYLAQKFAEYGLQPAGENSSFFQTFPITYPTLAEAPALRVAALEGNETTSYELYEDYGPVVVGYAGAGAGAGPIVWAGDCGPEDYEGLDAVGNVVLCAPGTGREAFINSSRHALAHGASGLLLLTDPEAWPAGFGYRLQEVWVPAPLPTFRVYPELVEDLLAGSRYSVDDLLNATTSFPLESRAALTVTTTAPAVYEARNVLGVIPGRDPAVADEVVVLGAHYDHMGQGPEGTTWGGANDNASGTALLLEVARAWKQQGYVPRRTVLFAAWDAEEWGLVGSRYYVQNPSYPLTATIANINADMIGSGNDVLSISGRLTSHLRAGAELFEVETAPGRISGSDHTSFEEAGVPSGFLIWMGEESPVANYHLPSDTASQIEPQKLEAAAKIAHLALLDLVESRPAVDEMLTRRADAILADDLDTFLTTTAPGREDLDRSWFADIRGWQPTAAELSVERISFAGDTAVADVQLKLERGEAAADVPYLADWQVRLQRNGSQWQWAGANLQRVENGTAAEATMAVAYPPDVEADLSRLGALAASEYQGIAAALGLPAAGAGTARLDLYPDESALRADLAPTLPTGQEAWVTPGAIRIAYTAGISESEQLQAALVQLVLADAGVRREDAPWLWEGLPLALRAGTVEGRALAAQSAAVDETFLPRLATALEKENPELSEATAWGAVEYLREQIGWDGIGRFIADLGRSGDPDPALNRAVGLHADRFAAAWEASWRSRLQTVQAELEAVLAARSAALRAGREDAFLRTVDPAVPGLLAAQQQLFRSLSPLAVEAYSTTVTPRVFLPDGDVLAQFSLSYRLNEAGTLLEGSERFRVRFNREGDSFQWAGLPLQTLAGDAVSVRYPEGQEAIAQAVLAEAEPLYRALATGLGVAEPLPVVLELYDAPDLMAASISPVFRQASWRPSWSASGTASKIIVAGEEPDPAGLRPVLASELTRQLLYQQGLGTEPGEQWLLHGLAIYLPWTLAPGAAHPALAHLQALAQATADDALFALENLPPVDRLEEDEYWLLQAQAWDSVHYLVEQYGQQALHDLLSARGAGASTAEAVEHALDRPAATFAAEWQASLAQGHLDPAWLGLARGFDEGVAQAHISALSAPALAGRAAGTAGAETAAGYIAERFAAYGLEPAGNVSQTTYFQSFPLTTTVVAAAPSFAMVESTTVFVYREHYLGVQATPAGTAAARPVVAELVWVGPDAASETDLEGKIMVTRAGETLLAQQIEDAREYGAGALLLLGQRKEEEDLLGKKPLLPHQIGQIPVVELSLSGSSFLLQEVGESWSSLPDLLPVQPLGLTGRIHFAAEVQQRSSANVLGLLPGRDPDLRDELLIVGAHYDHVGDDPDGYLCPPDLAAPPSPEQCEVLPGRHYSGANDDASGVASLLEIARVWQEERFRPRRSVLFAAWGAQELGEVGASYYVSAPTRPLTQTLAVMQLDGVAAGRGLNLGIQAEWAESGLWLAGIDQAWRMLEEKEVVFTVPLDASDHLPFRERGLPTVLVSWRLAGEDNLPDEVAPAVIESRLATAGRVITLSLLYLAR